MSLTRGVLLNRAGAAEGDATVETVKRRYMLAETVKERRGWNAVLDDLHQSSVYSGSSEPRMAGQSWRQSETPVGQLAASGAQIANTTSETIAVPDVTLAAGFMYVGRALKYTIFGEQSTVVTTPGTVIFRLRWGGVAGTALATSGAYAPDPTGASTSLACYVEYYLVCRAYSASAGSIFAMGRAWWNDVDDASVTTIIGNLNMHAFPNTPAVTGSLDTVTAKALSPTFTSSVSTSGTNFTAHIGILESLS